MLLLILRNDQQSSASSARHNEDRFLSSDGSIKQKVLGVKPGMTIAKDMLEFGSAEHVYFDESGAGSKELIERFIKLPKTMKDMLLQLGSELHNDESCLRALRVVGFCHTRK